MLAAIVVYGILFLIVILVRTENLSEKKRKIIIHSIGIALFISGLVLYYAELIKNNYDKSDGSSLILMLFLILFLPGMYYIFVWSFSNKKNVIICKVCKSKIEIDKQEILNKKFICTVCNREYDL